MTFPPRTPEYLQKPCNIIFLSTDIISKAILLEIFAMPFSSKSSPEVTSDSSRTEISQHSQKDPKLSNKVALKSEKLHFSKATCPFNAAFPKGHSKLPRES
ncbi:hypothetical protein NPIL_253091 [Nephila pilipes]|uniref:Uncharacterized protein n=1 Tax=Nephila pilipes TaxID=299642 RepID=A0A8X6QQI5_NEPPI|nr:hypothetical protein NPIL_253091 [Nephila pilipes]